MLFRSKVHQPGSSRSSDLHSVMVCVSASVPRQSNRVGSRSVAPHLTGHYEVVTFPTSSEAEYTPTEYAPAAGAVMDTVGGVRSGAASVVNVKSPEVARLLAASRDRERK